MEALAWELWRTFAQSNEEKQDSWPTPAPLLGGEGRGLVLREPLQSSPEALLDLQAMNTEPELAVRSLL